MTKAEEMLDALASLRYQAELSKQYERILARPCVASDQEDEKLVRQALKEYLDELEDAMEEEFEKLKEYLIMKRGG